MYHFGAQIFKFHNFFFVPLQFKTDIMTIRELINSVDSEQYSESPLYQKLRDTKPEYGSSRHIQVKVVDSEIAVTNVHVGSLGDILTYPIDVESDLNISKIQLLDAILKELSSEVLATQKHPTSGATSTICRRLRLSDDSALLQLFFYHGHIVFAHLLCCWCMATRKMV